MIGNRAPEDILPPLPRASRRFRESAWHTWATLTIALVLGTYFCTLGLFSWDEPSFRLHPDERFMVQVASDLRLPSSLAEYLDSARNPLNPRNHGHGLYVYGMLPQVLTRLTAVLLTPNTALPTDSPEHSLPKPGPIQALLNPDQQNLTDYWQIHKVGRAWSAVFSIGAIGLVFLIGRRLYGARVGSLAALLLALAVLPIQIAHFFTVDAATAFFTLLTVYWAVRIAQDGGPGSFVGLGLSVGATMACRITMATLGVLGVLAVAQRIWLHQTATDTHPHAPPGGDPGTPRSGPGALALMGLLVLAGLLALLTFRVLQPDAFVGTSFFDLRPEPRFVDNIRVVGQLISGEIDTPPGQQWVGRAPFVFPLKNMIIWGMGVPLGLAAWGGWAWAGWRLVRRRELHHLLPWSWIAFYFLWQGGQFVMTMRYYLPLYGLLALCAAWALVAIYDLRSTIYSFRPVLRRAGRRSGDGDRRRHMGWIPVAIVVLGTLCWAYAFTRIYTRPHSRITASRWIYAHIPPGSAITSEEWDDALPLNLDGHSSSQYVGIRMQPYAEDDPIKYTGFIDQNGTYSPGLLDQLDQADYIILSSNRVYDSATRLPMRYPALTRYYHSLFNGELGFKLVADITSYPTLFGIPIPDQSAEEAFSVYDHPRVLIFEKTPAYTRQRAEALITADVAWNEVYKLPAIRAERVPTALRLTAEQWPAYRAAGTWTELFQPAALARLAPWLAWLLVLELIGLGMVPLLFRALPGLPDRGFALAKTLGLLLVAYGAWMLASMRVGPGGAALMGFSPTSVWLCAGILIAAGALVGWRSRADLLAFVRCRRRALLTAEGLFLLAFFGFLLLRALNPDLWHPARGGEKPMDLAFLTAVLKSAAFPPYDPWFAGGYINYYYFGFVFVGALVHLTGIAPTIAYNLAVPTLFALTALGAWGVGYNLIAPARSGAPAGGLSATRAHIERRAIVGGGVAAMFVVVLGNLANAFYFLSGYAAQNAHRPEWVFWDATRIVGMALQDGTISEFPFFTFLYGDLHAHMMALPLALAALGLMVGLIRTKNKKQRTDARFASLFFVLCPLFLLALVIGALRATNTWDYPTYLGLSIATLALVAWGRRRGAGWASVVGRWVAGSVGLVLLSNLLFLPFTSYFATDYAGFELWRGTHTLAAEFLKINGLWLFLLLSAALVLYRRVRGASALTVAAIGGAALLLAVIAVALNASALLLIVPLVGGAAGLLLDLLGLDARPPDGQRLALVNEQPRDRRPDGLPGRVGGTGELTPRSAGRLDPHPAAPASLATLVCSAWALAALGLTLIPELIAARGDIGRMNTVFKLGMQSWVLFALSAAVALAWLWQPMRRAGVVGWAWRGAALLLVGAALVYPITATPARLVDRYDPRIGPTLDGAAYMRSGTWAENNRQFSFAEDAAALDWMRTHISGTPIVLEAHTEAYRWGGRVATYTGLPTLLGWTWHETQQRSVAQVGPVLASRQALVAQLYNTTAQDEALRLLQLYGVEYVYVGQLERALYDPSGLAKFDALASTGQIQLVYAGGETRIYQIPRADHPPAVLTTSLAVRAPTLPRTNDLMLDVPVDQLPQVNEYAWNPLASSQPVAVLLWLLAGYALLALGLPIAALVFESDQGGTAGTGWARLIGLLVLGYAVWMPVSMRLWHYDRWGLLLGVLLVLALDVGVLIARGQRVRRALSAERRALDGAGPLAAGRRLLAVGLRDLWDELRARRLRVLIEEALFLGAFALMLALRALNPDLWQPFWGGEKPFEFGLLNAILRSPVMPPYSPFFSDGILNYYYYGLFLVSLPVKATGIAPAVAFNLIVPLVFALTVTGVFNVVTHLTGRMGLGLVGVAFVALLGNLAAAFAVGWSQGLAPVWRALEGGLAGFGTRLDSWFVGPSRVIPNTINEFPYWSFLFADLHPHLIALPITILVIALTYQLFGGQRPALAARQPTDRQIRRWGRWVLLGLALGALAVTNSWDFPTYTLLLGGALLGRAWRERHRSGHQLAIALARAAIATLAVAAGALLLYLPFFQNFVALVRGIDRVRDGTTLSEYALLYGLFLAVLVPVVFGAAWRLLHHRERAAGHAHKRGALTKPSAATPIVGIVAPPAQGNLHQRLRMAVIVAPMLLVVIALTQPALGLKLWLGALILLGLATLLSRRVSAETWYLAWLAVVAWAVSLGIELVYVRDHLAGGDWYRMNTVFKFGFQVWVLLALAAAAALPVLARGLQRMGMLAESVGWAIFAMLVGLALVFPLVGTPSRLAYRFPETTGPTLDGLAFMERASYDWNGNQISLRADGEAIRWLNQHIRGTPVVLQSSLEFYRAYGVRVAANTGLPTVVSPLHENEQRDPSLVAERDAEVQRIYSTPDQGEALRLLSKYHVGYVYVGPIERIAYGQAGTTKFDQMVGAYLDLAYSNDGVKIYRVKESVFSIPPLPAVEAQPPAAEPGLAALERQVAANPTAAAPAFGLAQRYRDMGRLEQAAAVLEPAIRANPQDIPLHHLWGDILRDLGRYDEAEAAYRAAALAGPTAGNYNKLGAELLKMGRVDRAIAALLQAIAIDSSVPEPHFYLGQAYEQQGQNDRALEEYRTYLELAPPDGVFRAQASEAIGRLAGNGR